MRWYGLLALIAYLICGFDHFLLVLKRDVSFAAELQEARPLSRSQMEKLQEYKIRVCGQTSHRDLDDDEDLCSEPSRRDTTKTLAGYRELVDGVDIPDGPKGNDAFRKARDVYLVQLFYRGEYNRAARECLKGKPEVCKAARTAAKAVINLDSARDNCKEGKAAACEFFDTVTAYWMQEEDKAGRTYVPPASSEKKSRSEPGGKSHDEVAVTITTPMMKEYLQDQLDAFKDQCRSGITQACSHISQVEDILASLDGIERMCRRGDKQACSQYNQLRDLVANEKRNSRSGDVYAQVRLTPEQQKQWDEFRETGKTPRDPRTGKRPEWFWRCLNLDVDCDQPSQTSREERQQRPSERERSSDRYEYESSGVGRSNVSPEVNATRNLVDRALRNAREVPQLVDKALKGDPEAQAELERRKRWANQMAGMLEGQAAAQGIMNSVRRQELGSQWRSAAHTDRELARYYASQGDMSRSRYHANRATEFDKGAERLLNNQ
jgi:hypothetical protein